MNTEYVYWFVILVAVGIGAVVFMAAGPVPEIPEEPEPGRDGATDTTRMPGAARATDATRGPEMAGQPVATLASRADAPPRADYDVSPAGPSPD